MMDDDECGAVGGMSGREKPTYSEKTCPQCHVVYHKSHITSPGLERRPPLLEVGD
jgi:hypothetical protein